MMAYSSQREPIVITDSPSPAPSVITISDDSDGETMETSNKRCEENCTTCNDNSLTHSCSLSSSNSVVSASPDQRYGRQRSSSQSSSGTSPLQDRRKSPRDNVISCVTIIDSPDNDDADDGKYIKEEVKVECFQEDAEMRNAPVIKTEKTESPCQTTPPQRVKKALTLTEHELANLGLKKEKPHHHHSDSAIAFINLPPLQGERRVEPTQMLPPLHADTMSRGVKIEDGTASKRGYLKTAESHLRPNVSRAPPLVVPTVSGPSVVPCSTSIHPSSQQVSPTRNRCRNVIPNAGPQQQFSSRYCSTSGMSSPQTTLHAIPPQPHHLHYRSNIAHTHGPVIPAQVLSHSYHASPGLFVTHQLPSTHGGGPVYVRSPSGNIYSTYPLNATRSRGHRLVYPGAAGTEH